MNDNCQYPGLGGPRFEIGIDSDAYPAILRDDPDAPDKIYGIGDPSAIQPGVAVIGARKATPYGLSCAGRFAKYVATRKLPLISGGARGIDQAAMLVALEAGCPVVVVLGGGADVPYPRDAADLFQMVIDSGGAIISRQRWGTPPTRYTFSRRNRIIAALSALVLVVEAGLPSGTFSTADAALQMDRAVAAVPGPITSPASEGTNQLILDGARMIVGETSLAGAIDIAFAALEAR